MGSAERRAANALGIRRFELVRCLGAGATGAVFEALDATTGARVALKLLHEQTGHSLLRLKQEFRVLAEITHPNLVRFGGLFEEQGQFYFTMELVEGQEFLDFVRPLPTGGGGRLDSGAGESPPTGERPVLLGGDLAVPRRQSWHGRRGHPGVLDPARLQHGLTQLASALMALHAAGLVHRDVKPQNILVTRTGRVVLLDFGLAVSMTEGNATDLAGTMAYMPPEQALGQDVRGSADWYSVGVLLHEALTGQLPASHQRIRNFWLEAKAKQPPAGAAEQGAVGDLSNLSARLLEFVPDRRPDEAAIARWLGLELEVERGRAGLRSQVQYRGGTFVARERELAVLRAALARARSGDFTVVCVNGESGIGKSTLMRQLTGELRNEGEVVVLASRCYDNETMSYRGVDALIDALVGHLQTSVGDGEPFLAPEYVDYLVEVFPVFRALPGLEDVRRPPRFDADPQDAREKAFKAFKAVFRAAALERPILMCVDDAQWLDADSIALLASLLRERSARALLVLCQRPTLDQRHAALLDAAGGCDEISVGPLSEQHSEELVQLMLEGSSVRSDVDPSALARTSCGHPLFIQELVLHARRTRGQAATLDEVIHLRLAGLNDRARELLELIAVATEPLRNIVAREASASSSDIFPWLLSELRSQNLVSFNSDAMSERVQIYHDRFRELILQTMDAKAQRRAHELLARAFEMHAPEEMEALAHHWAGAGNIDSAARYAARAGWRALETLTFEHAATQFLLALRFEVRADVRTKIEVSLGDALAGSGRGVDAAAAYLRAADGESQQAALELRRRASEQLLGAGHVEQGSELLFSVLRRAGEFVPRNDLSAILWLVRALIEMSRRGLVIEARTAPLSERESLALRACWTAATGLSMVHHLRATAFQARALLLALDAGDLDRVVRSAALLSATLGNADGAVRKIGERLRDRARELAAISASEESRAWVDLTCGVGAMGEWDFRRCELLCSSATATFRARCAAWETATSRAFMLWSAAFRGDFHGVVRSLPELLAEARARGDRHAETALILSPLHLVGLAADDPERVRVQCARSMAEWPSKLACFQHMCGSYVLAQADLYQARSVSAWEHVTYAWRMLKSAHLARVQFQRIDLLSLRARAALARARDSRGPVQRHWLRRVQSDVRRLRRERSPAAVAFADMIHGAHEHVQGNRESSLHSLGAAADGFERLAMLLHAGVCRFSAAMVAGDAESLAAAERGVGQLGVVNPRAMVRLWAPGVAPT